MQCIVSTPANILEAVDRGVDFFDCVYPSRNGRHGHLYTKRGHINILNARYELDDTPIEEGCNCPACRSYSKAYIRHLLKAGKSNPADERMLLQVNTEEGVAELIDLAHNGNTMLKICYSPTDLQ